MEYLKTRQLGLGVALVALVVDWVTKAWVLENIPPFRWVVEGQLGVILGWNRGMSFSLLHDAVWAPWVLGGLAVVACGWFIHWLGQEEIFKRWHQMGLGLVIGGAAGNLVDRVQHGAVVDFIVVNPYGLFPWTFNVADACITMGVVVLLGLEVLKFKNKGGM